MILLNEEFDLIYYNNVYSPASYILVGPYHVFVSCNGIFVHK